MDPNYKEVSSRNEPKRVGYWLSEKKTRELRFPDFAPYFLDHGLDLVKINLNEDFVKQGPFAAIVHKLSDIVIRGDQGNEEAKDICNRFEEYVSSHPETVIIDPLPNVRQLLDRYRQYKIIQSCNLGSTVFTPPFVKFSCNDVEENLSKLKQHNVEFPVVCKPSLAHGSTLAHQMCLIFGPQGLKDVQPPCVAQAFVCHGAVLYKVFIVGQKYYVIERPSLKNFKAGDQETIYFDSHDVSKTTSTSWLIKLDEADLDIQLLRPETKKLEWLAGLVQQTLHLDLFGIDVIVESSTGRYAIIDINTFPGYKGFPNLREEMCDLVLSHLKPQKCDTTPAAASCKACQSVGFSQYGSSGDQMPCLCCPVNVTCSRIGLRTQVAKTDPLKDNTEDSGIDTSDSCDEKKLKGSSVVKNVKRQHSKSIAVMSANKWICH